MKFSKSAKIDGNMRRSRGALVVTHLDTYNWKVDFSENYSRQKMTE